MSLPPYPPSRYDGANGEVDVRLRRVDEPPEVTYASGVTVDYLATGASTGGDFGLYRWTFGPGQSGPGPHFHRTITESFYVLTGAVSLYDGTGWVEAGPGDFLHVPPGGVHGFKNVLGEPASMLLMFTPGAPREDYFETLAAVSKGLELSDEERAEFYLRHDNHWVD
ncbi:cupin domain-containing protein [Jiangella alba]|uniref:Cupin domain protein n=1 Tax=Jiangella alba TaxID=561176 RepID=A0A1H5PFT4_9ACTN|nr:cupin domain-containing protein [Jiangella alba]SEF12610.1 Cupin domain protein [Jiangella alba]